MEPKNYHNHGQQSTQQQQLPPNLHEQQIHLQQLQHQQQLHQHQQQQHQQQQQHEQPQAPQQAGFAPRRQYDNMDNSSAALAAACLANGNTGSGGPSTGKSAAMQRPKIKKEKQLQVLQQQQQMQISELNAGSASTLPTDDALKFVNDTEANGLAMKTPVSILQELLSRRGITPGYELVQIEGAIHEPTFRFRVSFKDKDTPFTAMGAGRSKKEAKHAAARALIDKLIGVQLESQGNLSSTGSTVGCSISGSGGDGNANVSGSGE